MHPSRRLYRWSVFGALPGGLWMAFELYGLTLRGPQPLFHWVIEHLLPLVLVVWLAIPIGAACLFQTLWGLMSPDYRARLAMPQLALATIALAMTAQAAALMTYSNWSDTGLRVPVCVVGLGLTAVALRAVLRFVVPPNPSATSR